MGLSTVQITWRGPDRYSNSKMIIKKKIILYKTQVTIQFQWNPYNIGLQGLDIIDTYTNSIVEMYFYLI